MEGGRDGRRMRYKQLYFITLIFVLQNNIYQSEHLHDHSCPSTTREGSMMSFAGEIRRKSRSKATVHGKCTKQDKDEASFVVNKK